MVSNKVSSYVSTIHSLAGSNDVELDTDIADKSVLSYNAPERVWVNKPAGDLGLSTKNLNFLASDWVAEGTKYVLNVPETTHGQGSTIFIKTFEGTTTMTEVFVGWTSDSQGNLKLSISKAPDSRFTGVLSVCKLLLV